MRDLALIECNILIYLTLKYMWNDFRIVNLYPYKKQIFPTRVQHMYTVPFCLWFKISTHNTIFRSNLAHFSLLSSIMNMEFHLPQSAFYCGIPWYPGYFFLICIKMCNIFGAQVYRYWPMHAFIHLPKQFYPTPLKIILCKKVDM